jgi:hypothetical protein
MSSWLELLLWKCFTHPHPSISTSAFQHLHGLTQATNSRAPANPHGSPSSSEATVGVSTPSPLTPSMILGPILALFDEPSSLFSPDKQRVSSSAACDRAQLTSHRLTIVSLASSLSLWCLFASACIRVSSVQRGTHRLGDHLLEVFLVDYMTRLPNALMDQASEAHQTTKQQFIRSVRCTHIRQYMHDIPCQRSSVRF